MFCCGKSSGTGDSPDPPQALKTARPRAAVSGFESRPFRSLEPYSGRVQGLLRSRRALLRSFLPGQSLGARISGRSLNPVKPGTDCRYRRVARTA